MTRTATHPHVTALEHVFDDRPIARLEELRRALDVSGRTVFRLLGTVGYFSSYSHAGQYYTLARTPAFDADGLWAHAGVRFSRHRTLRQTVVHLVNTAPTGQTHAELQDRLGLRVYDTLTDLVAVRAIGRAERARRYLYVSTEPGTADGQLAARQRLLSARPPRSGLCPDPAVVIEVLLAVIQSPTPEVAAVAAWLRAQGTSITQDQVEAVWALHDLGKKKPASPRSRRCGSR